MNYGLIACVGGMVLASIISAFYWHKSHGLRYLTIYYGIFAGICYSLFFRNDQKITNVIEVTLYFTVAGLIMYFAVWIQCREQRKP